MLFRMKRRWAATPPYSFCPQAICCGSAQTNGWKQGAQMNLHQHKQKPEYDSVQQDHLLRASEPQQETGYLPLLSSNVKVNMRMFGRNKPSPGRRKTVALQPRVFVLLVGYGLFCIYICLVEQYYTYESFNKKKKKKPKPRPSIQRASCQQFQGS
jgi:hypothetical protein